MYLNGINEIVDFTLGHRELSVRGFQRRHPPVFTSSKHHTSLSRDGIVCDRSDHYAPPPGHYPTLPRVGFTRARAVFRICVNG